MVDQRKLGTIAAFGTIAALAVMHAAMPATAATKAVSKSASKSSIQLDVDARDAARGTFRARLEIAARPGTLTLVYPKWIPGEHGPTGPINGIVGLQFGAGGKPLVWQ